MAYFSGRRIDALSLRNDLVLVHVLQQRRQAYPNLNYDRNGGPDNRKLSHYSADCASVRPESIPIGIVLRQLLSNVF